MKFYLLNKNIMINKLIKQFNTSDTSLIISGYPQEKGKQSNHGIAWYTQQSIEPIASKFGKQFVVLTENNANTTISKLEKHAHNKVLVWRLFDKSKIYLYPQILRALKNFPKIKQVFVHSEFGTKGMWHFALLIPFLLLIKLTGTKITFFSHNVLDNVQMLSGHLNLSSNSILTHFLNLALKVYYFLLGALVNKIVVLDEVLVKRLKTYVPEHKIVSLPIPVESKKPKITQVQAKKQLNYKKTDKVLLFFGFVTWYKGADWLIKTFDKLVSNSKEPVKLIIAGGPSYSLKNKAYYQEYYQQLVQLADKNPNITLTGFVKQELIEAYFQAADLTIFPYRGLMGASGSMNHALSYHKPFVVSQDMKEILLATDIKKILAIHKLQINDLTFSLTTDGLKSVISLINHGYKLRALSKISKAIAQSRNITQQVDEEYCKIYQDQTLLNQSAYQLG